MDYNKYSRKRKLIDTFIIFSAFIAEVSISLVWVDFVYISLQNKPCVHLTFQGISGGMPGPTLLDLQELTHSETDEISLVFIVKSGRFHKFHK